MIINIVHMHVKPEAISQFLEISRYNADNSRKEPGIARFDLIQQKDDPDQFLFYEVFRSDDAIAKHREAEHYLRWREAIGDLLVEPRHAIRYQNVTPADEIWG
jgi:quinol monooxygenase YgiN